LSASAVPASSEEIVLNEISPFDLNWMVFAVSFRSFRTRFDLNAFPRSIMVFAVIGIGHKSQLLIVSGSIDAEKSIENCMEVNFMHDFHDLRGHWNWLLSKMGQHVTCPPGACMDGRGCLVQRDFPPNSSDLSLVETCWAVLKLDVFVQKPQTVEELKTALQSAWTGIPPKSVTVCDDIWLGQMPEAVKGSPHFGSQHSQGDANIQQSPANLVLQSHPRK
jgi:hypothetical protein